MTYGQSGKVEVSLDDMPDRPSDPSVGYYEDPSQWPAPETPEVEPANPDTTTGDETTIGDDTSGQPASSSDDYMEGFKAGTEEAYWDGWREGWDDGWEAASV